MWVGSSSGDPGTQNNWRVCISLGMELNLRELVVSYGVPIVTWTHVCRTTD